VLAQHARVVAALVPHEPPAVTLLPDGEAWIEFFHHVYELYRSSGPEAAREEFFERAYPGAERPTPRPGDRGEQAVANRRYWFEHELRQYPAARLDLDALAAHAGRVLPTAGRESRGQVCHLVSLELGTRLGRRVTEMPGGHAGVATHPAEFAQALVELLA
jgi:hypothetical protein